MVNAMLKIFLSMALNKYEVLIWFDLIGFGFIRQIMRQKTVIKLNSHLLWAVLSRKSITQLIMHENRKIRYKHNENISSHVGLQTILNNSIG